MARVELLALLCLAGTLGAQATAGPRPDARVGVYELKLGDFSVKVTNWGARLMSVVLPDCKGNLADIVLGRDTVAEYFRLKVVLPTQNDTSYFGPITGRVAQRISRGRFVLDGKVYHLQRNDGRNTIHGGGTAFSKSVWTVKEYVGGGDSPYVTLYYHSFDGEQGFPGNLDAYVTYRVSGPYTLGVHMSATALDRATPVNLLLHAYWNLGGQGSGDVLGHELRLHASRYAVLDEELLPSSGRVAPVAGTPLDFRTPTPIGARIRQVTGGKVVGYDANYVVDGEGMRPVAQVRDGASGRAVELWANQATVQLYTGNWLNHTQGKGGGVYDQYAGFTLETMGYVDAVNHPEFPSQTLLPGQEYKHDMVFKFSF
ncbi:Galactose mutarotase-like superfamily protein [Zea mays]|uniref:Aldose 1-epimerase n=1 Tax=Zea mays TaxID=4577 RepID=A0A1D6E987_MAIZE|nr:Galactose mutarotase-like superfamily protein [Zea mays]